MATETEVAPNLNTAIEDAIKTTPLPEAAVELTTEEATEETKTEATAETKTELDAQAAAEAELALQGKQLMLALKDPEKAGIVIKFLAEQAGYTKVETKADAKEAKDEILESLKESLGAEFDFLADKLAPAIKKVVDIQLALNTQDIRKTFEAQQLQNLQQQSDAALKSLSTEFFGKDEIPDDVATEMSGLMDKYPPSKNSTIKDYVKDMFDMATARKGSVKVGKGGAADGRGERNRTDAASRLSTSGGAQPSGVVVDSTKTMTIDQAVKAAMEAASKK